MVNIGQRVAGGRRTPRSAASFVSLLLAGLVVSSPAEGQAPGAELLRHLPVAPEGVRLERAVGSLRIHTAPPPTFAARTGVVVELPLRADAPIRLTDAGSRVQVDVTLVDARPAPAVESGGRVRYRGASPRGTDLWLVPRHDGVEDYVVLEEPATPLARYRLALGAVPGLRVVAGAVELLDARGAPRLRMAPPYLIDARGRRVVVTTSLQGCAFDADPRPPWRRAVTSPGASSCEVVLTLPPGAEVAYPALLDPIWSSTAAMAEARATVPVLVPGYDLVLMAGGFDGARPLASAELYDLDTGTWAMTGALPSPRADTSVTPVDDGDGVQALVAGGCTAETVCGFTADAALYDPATGLWSATGSMLGPRARQHTCNLLTGEVMYMGGVGTDALGAPALATSEIYDPVSRTFRSGPPLTVPREGFAASALDDGRLLIAGGGPQGAGTPSAVASAELYDPALDAWVEVAPMNTPRYAPSSTRLPDGRLLVLGGSNDGVLLATGEIFDPETGTWSPAGTTSSGRRGHALAALSNGWVVSVGGCCGAGRSVESFRPTPGNDAAWQPLDDLPGPRVQLGVVFIDLARFMFVGGRTDLDGLAVNSAFVLELAEAGEACVGSAGCRSGFCLDGVCCEGPCDGGCRTCSAALGAPADGVCASVPEGALDPRGLCLASPEDPCGGTGRCTSEATCELEPADAPCTCGLSEGRCDGGGQCACLGDVCDGPSSVRRADGTVESCEPLTCLDGRCRQSCDSSLDCAEGYVCDATRWCVAPGPRPVEEGGCAAGPPGPRSGPRNVGPGVVGLLGLWLVRRRRHAHPRDLGNDAATRWP